MNIIQKPSPNFTRGRGVYKPELIVIHIMDGTLAGTADWFQFGSANEGRPVSAHYGVGANGEVHQYVAEENQAWHAGRVSLTSFKLWKQGVNPNLYTIGIEHEGNANSVWSAAMKSTSAELIKQICLRNNIPIDRDHIIGHYQIFSDKPNCPAINKGIIDELVALAQPTVVIQPVPVKVEMAIALLEQALKVLRS